MSQNPITGREESIITEHSTGIRPGGDARKRQAVYDYVFSRDGGAVGTFLLRGPVLPDNAIITDAYIDTVVALAGGGGATVGLGFASTTDINAEDAISGAPWSTTGPKDADAGPDPGDETTFIKLSAAVGLQITIGAAALTAGQFFVIVDYDVTEG
jgi:hypothetical protein